MGEILLPPRAEIDVPPPEPPDERLGVPVIMRPQPAGLARVGFCFGHGCWVWWGKDKRSKPLLFYQYDVSLIVSS